MNKVVKNADEAIRDVQDGAVIMSGGFGLCGNPENLIAAIHRKGIKNLTIISNNCGTTDKGLGVLLQTRQVRKMIASYVGENKEVERLVEVVELDPDTIHVPSIYVKRLFQGCNYQKWIEKRTVRALADATDSRTDRRARGQGIEGRHVREPRHRAADVGGELPAE